MGILIVFVDSLRADAVAEMPFLARLPEIGSARPGFGYSINLHAELFAGLRPDDVGFFCEWHLAPDESPGRRIRPVLPLLDAVFRPYILNRGVQYLLTRWYRPDHIMPNIPLRHLDKFAVAGEPIFSPRFPAPTLFTRYPELHVIRPPRTVKKGQRDAWVVAQAEEAMRQHASLFLALADLDTLTHHAGVGSEAYRNYLHQLDTWLATLHARFRRLYPEGHFWVLSDHGMANVQAGVYLDIEERLGRAGLHSFMYFSDSTLLRVWVFDERLRQPVGDYLASYPWGQLLTPEERAQYGLTSPNFGDYILVLDEGYCFEPSTFARHIPVAMHGYHPELSSQQALYAHEGPALSMPATLLDIYTHLDKALEQERESK